MIHVPCRKWRIFIGLYFNDYASGLRVPSNHCDQNFMKLYLLITNICANELYEENTSNVKTFYSTHN